VASLCPLRPFIVDVGGEGRHELAWNINPSRFQTIGRHKGRAIPRWPGGRADKIPLPCASVDWLIVERTPLSKAALREFARVIVPTGRITLRHTPFPWKDRHALAKAMLPGHVCQRLMRIGDREVQETEFRLGLDADCAVAGWPVNSDACQRKSPWQLEQALLMAPAAVRTFS
jgi:hypothetical protein